MRKNMNGVVKSDLPEKRMKETYDLSLLHGKETWVVHGGGWGAKVSPPRKPCPVRQIFQFRREEFLGMEKCKLLQRTVVPSGLSLLAITKNLQTLK